MFRRTLSRKKITYPESRYELVTDPRERNEAFVILQKWILAYCQKLNRNTPGSAVFFLETGKIEHGRSYFFLKPRDMQGWLCEESPAGWVISRSEKIVEQDLFLRTSIPWDIASLHSKPELGRARVSSAQTQEQIISLSLYCKLLEAAIGQSV